MPLNGFKIPQNDVCLKDTFEKFINIKKLYSHFLYS